MADEPTVEQMQELHAKALREIREATTAKDVKSAAAYLEGIENKLKKMGAEPTPTDSDPLSAAMNDDQLLERFEKLSLTETRRIWDEDPAKFKRIMAALERRGARALYESGGH